MLGFLSSDFRSSIDFETTVEMTWARDSHRRPIASPISASRSALDTEDELTTLEVVTLAEFLEAVMKAEQVLVQAGCAPVQFAHFA